MNRRQMARWGFVGGLVYRPGSRLFAVEPVVMPDGGVAREPVPESAAQDPPLSLRDAIAQGRLTASWVATAPNQVRLTIRNGSDRNLVIRVDPGTIVTDGKARWLAGSPARYEGAFGGAYVSETGDSPMRNSAIPVAPGRETALALPAVRLGETEQGSKADPARKLKVETVETWSADNLVRKALLGIGMLGASLPVAQAIAWRSVESKDWKTLASRPFQGRVLNEFEKQAVDRYLARIGTVAAITPEEIRDSLIAGLLETHVRPTPGKEAAGNRLAVVFDGRYVLGLPLGKISVGKADPKLAKPIRLELAVAEVLSAEPLRMVVDCSLSSQATASGGTIRWARTRLLLDSESSDDAEAADRFLETLSSRLARVLVRSERTGQGAMFSRFRLENRSPWTMSAVALRTDRGDSAPAVWPLDGLGLSPRGRIVVPVPAERAEPVDLRWSPI